MNIEDRRYAVLIDADNVSDKYVKIILDEINTDEEWDYLNKKLGDKYD